MTARQVLLRKNAVPFLPFEFFLADGRTLPVPHPDFLSVAESEELVHVHDLNGGVEVVDLLLVVSLRVPAKNSAPTPS